MVQYFVQAKNHLAKDKRLQKILPREGYSTPPFLSDLIQTLKCWNPFRQDVFTQTFNHSRGAALSFNIKDMMDFLHQTLMELEF